MQGQRKLNPEKQKLGFATNLTTLNKSGAGMPNCFMLLQVDV
jgi:hypothetical protein